MSHPVKCALITAFVSKTKDRFHDYNARWNWRSAWRSWPRCRG